MSELPTPPVKSWKTTALGVLTIVGSLVGGAIQWLKTGALDFATISIGVTAGVGLILAKDHV